MFPAAQTSQGKVLLAALPPDRLAAVLAQPSRSGLPLGAARPVRDGTGVVRAAMNVTVHATETSTARLVEDHLPPLLTTAGLISADWALWQSRAHIRVRQAPA